MTDPSDALFEALRHAFPAHDPAPLLAQLLTYGEQAFHNEPARVRLAIVQLCAGDVTRLAEYLAVAREDYRDVLHWASRPLPTPEQTAAELTAARALLDRWGDK